MVLSNDQNNDIAKGGSRCPDFLSSPLGQNNYIEYDNICMVTENLAG